MRKTDKLKINVIIPVSNFPSNIGRINLRLKLRFEVSKLSAYKGIMY